MRSRGGRLAARSAVLAVSLLLAGNAATPIGPIPLDAHLKGMWSPVAPWPLVGIHAVLLPEGRVLTYGTDANGQATGSFIYDVWDPAAGLAGDAHLTLPNGTGTDIFCSAQLVLPHSGAGVLLAGGDIWNGTSITDTGNNNSNTFDPSTNTLTRGNNMNRARWYATATTLPNGETYIQGGKGGADRPEIRSESGTFRLLTNANTSSLSWYYPRNFVAPDGRVFGYDEFGIMYYVDPNGLGAVTAVGQLPSANRGKNASAAMFRPGRILQYGGASSGAVVIDITGGNPVVTPTQSMSKQRRWSTATLLADGKVLATGGSVVSNTIDNTLPDGGVSYEAEIWNPASGTWTLGARGAKPRLYHSTALLLPDATVLVAGGGANGPVTNLNAEIYYPPYLFGPNGTLASRPAIAWAPELLQLGQSFTVDVDAAASISRVTLVKTGSVTHGWNMEQRFLELGFGASSSASLFVQAPARFNDAPPGHYLLFVINSAGVPSLARIVRIEPAGTNQAPTVNAGPNLTVTLPNSANLTGSATDDALPNPPAAMTITWSKLSGPGTVSFGNAASAQTTASFSAAGSYVLRLTASDSALSASDDVAVTVNPAPATNQAPVVNAGADLTVTLPSSANLTGSATDDALPNPPAVMTLTWSKVSGPGTVTFGNAAAAQTTASFSAAGSYVLRLTASDGSLSTSDDVAVTVNPAPATNQAPLVNAGSDLTVTLPNSANLTGSATDDNLPNPPGAMTITWSKLSGPGTVSFGNAASAQTTASFSAAGSYVLRLTASDSALSASDDVAVTVNPAPATNQAPVVNAGSDMAVTLPNSVLLQGSATDDGLPNPPSTLTYSWTKVSGSGSVTFGTPTSPTTTASFSTSAKGTFVLRLTVSDGALTASDQVSVAVTPCVKVKGKCQ